MALSTLIGRARGPVIGGVQIDVSVRDSHTQRREVSDSPIETNSDVSDHSKRLPAEVEIEGVISDNPTSLTDRITQLATGKTAQVRYRELLDLVDNADTFDLVTGLRSYVNMVFTSFTIVRDATTGNEAIHFRANMRELEFADSEEVVVRPNTTDAPKVQSKVDRGPKAKKPAPPAPAQESGSLLGELTGGKSGANATAAFLGGL